MTAAKRRSLISVEEYLAGEDCPYNSDMKVRVPPPPYERFFYPDASVTCSSVEPDAAYLQEPVVLFEVLSKATRRIDEGEELPGNLCLEQETAIVTVIRRQGQNFEREIYDGMSEPEEDE